MQLDIQAVKLEIYVPEEFIEPLRDALANIGVCKIGDYSHVVSYQKTKGYWKPLRNSHPYHGEKGEICFGTEAKMEVRCPFHLAEEGVQVIKRIHPYEEPVINIIPLLNSMFD